MIKFRNSLRFRITVFTIIIMTIASIFLVVLINGYINKIMPQVSVSIIQDVQAGENGAIQQGGDQVTQGGFVITGHSVTKTMNNAVTNIYIQSLIFLVLIIIIGGIATYFILNHALKPVFELNRNIREINANNLLSNLNLKGPNDEIKELKMSFNQMIARLNNAFNSQKRFNSHVAHELKTPLAVIKTNIEVLNEQNGKSEQDYERLLDLATKSVNKMNNIIETLLDMVRNENSRLDEDVDVNEIIEDVVTDLQTIAGCKNVNITNELRSTKSIQSNHILFYRAIYNIVENAIKYNIQDGNIYIETFDENSNIIIKIKDTGKGIPNDVIHNIFEPFFRVDNIENKSSLGLGLALAKSTIELHNGTIIVTSKFGEGTDFLLSLPVTS
ncbi:sensor histidine kinase [Clostridium peptidivorans]|uniref:sensor histidine kinase n=1 Tax=Clostridium peptidivorans TaxID=100174 RepID=UPI000BE46B5A|nr:HAMP domain-containing sensor histidine kinase [Clostridium peptidivorans]